MTTIQLDADFKTALKKTIVDIKGLPPKQFERQPAGSRKSFLPVCLGDRIKANQVHPANYWQPNLD